MLSVKGLKVVLPAYAIAVTISGDARKFIVSGLPSLRPRKLRLYDVKIALPSPFVIPSVRFHCPMQGYVKGGVSYCFIRKDSRTLSPPETYFESRYS